MSDERTHASPTAHHDDTTVLFGRTLPLPLYTVVFLGLGILTVIEVIIAELPDGWLTAPLLITLSAIKAVAVVYYYMHLREDNRVFAIALILPVFMAMIALLFLVSVPTTGY